MFTSNSVKSCSCNQMFIGYFAICTQLKGTLLVSNLIQCVVMWFSSSTYWLRLRINSVELSLNLMCFMWNNYLLLHLFTFQSPFPFFSFPAFASLLQSYCAVFCRICYIFSHLLYISAPIRTLSGEFEALHSPKRILTPLQQKFPQFTASKLVKFFTKFYPEESKNMPCVLLRHR